jgi:hypothetical protein
MLMSITPRVAKPDRCEISAWSSRVAPLQWSIARNACVRDFFRTGIVIARSSVGQRNRACFSRAIEQIQMYFVVVLSRSEMCRRLFGRRHALTAFLRKEFGHPPVFAFQHRTDIPYAFLLGPTAVFVVK